MATEISTCPRCGSMPELQKMGSYWRAKCPKHAMLPATSLIGHPMKTKKSAIDEWNRMTSGIRERTAAIRKGGAG